MVTPYYYLSWSNEPVELINEEFRIISNLGHDVDIITTDIFNKKVKNNNPNIKVYKSYGIFPFIFSINIIKDIKKNIKKYEIIHIHEYRTFLSMIVSYYANKYSVPYIIQAHGAIPYYIGRKMSKMLFDLLIGKRILKKSKGMIALNKKEFDQYLSLGADKTKISIIPNGIDYEKYSKINIKEDILNKKYNIKNNKIILYVGRIDESKGIDILIEAFRLLVDNRSNCKLVIVGRDYGFKNNLVKLTKKLKLERDIIFTGFVSFEEKKKIISESHIFVTPKFSGFPHTFLEAISFGIPIITTEKGDNLKWINNVGIITKYDKNEICKALIVLLDKEEKYRKYSENGIILAKEKFNWLNICKELELLYENNKK